MVYPSGVVNKDVQKLQEQICALAKQGRRIALHSASNCNTTRSKSYNKKCYSLDMSRFKMNRFWLNQLSSQRLWKLHHKAEKWVQDRLIIQDCCMPSSKAQAFLKKIMKDTGVFPIWLCPIKNTTTPQIFAPHYLPEPILNVGLYGLPIYSAPMKLITSRLEQRTREYGGRKVLYSRSFYTSEEFWEIYDRSTYEDLRQRAHAEGVWPEITMKVLSE